MATTLDQLAMSEVTPQQMDPDQRLARKVTIAPFRDPYLMLIQWQVILPWLDNERMTLPVEVVLQEVEITETEVMVKKALPTDTVFQPEEQAETKASQVNTL